MPIRHEHHDDHDHRDDKEDRMYQIRPVRPQEARRLLAASLRRLDALMLETFTPVWVRPRTER